MNEYVINEIMKQIKAGIDEAINSGICCGYPEYVTVIEQGTDKKTYPFQVEK